MVVSPEPIRSTKSPRQLLLEHFSSVIPELPIRGGWGYTMQDAVIIDRNDPIVSKEVPFDGVAIEYKFVEARIYAEVILLRPPGQGFVGIKWRLLRQHLSSWDSHYYDVLETEISGFLERDSLDLNALRLEQKEKKKVRFGREFWFDITSFYGDPIRAE